MSLSLAESQAINEIASHLYDFLPGKPHPYADQAISFKGVAYKISVGQFWSDGSKLPSLTQLLERTLENRRDRFCDLILGIVRTGLIYRNNKSNPINREEIKHLNELLMKVRFKISDLWDPAFLDSLPSVLRSTTPVTEITAVEQTMQLKDALVGLSQLAPQPRGFAFEKFLNELFDVNGLAPRGSFRLVGEQIDGSFQLGQDTYLVEAKWHNEQIGQTDLLVFYGKVQGKSTWSRGIFISNSGFTEDGITAVSRGRPINMIGMTGQDLFFILNGEMPLREAIEKKTRRAAEEGQFFISIFDLKR
jgi:hypothetical protein